MATIMMGGKPFELRALGFKKADAFRQKLETEAADALSWLGLGSIFGEEAETPTTEVAAIEPANSKKKAADSSPAVAEVAPKKGVTYWIRQGSKAYIPLLCEYSPEFERQMSKVEDDLTDKEIKDAFEAMILQLYPTLEWAKMVYPMMSAFLTNGLTRSQNTTNPTSTN